MNYELRGKIVGFFMPVINFKRGLLISFLLGFFVRLVPELLSYPYLIGFDTVEYAFRLQEGIIWYHWSNVFSQSWLFYSLIILIHKASGLTPEITLKIASSMLYGFNTAGIYFFANKTLKWKTEKSLLTSALFAFNIASLRLSWDLNRNILGIGMLLFALSLMPKNKNSKRDLGFLLLSVLTVFSYELSAASLLFIAIILILKELRESHKANGLRILILLLPAFIIFLLRVYFRVSQVKYEVKTNVINIQDVFEPHPLGLFFLTNYLGTSGPVEHYNNYLELSLNVVALFSLLYVIWLPLITKGFFRDKLLDNWTLLLLAGSFGPLIIPFSSLFYWNRWMFMLVYPFTFYAVNGIEKFHVQLRLKWLKYVAGGITVATMLLGTMFMALPSNLAPFYTPPTSSYLPSSMQQNTIPLEDVEDTTKCLEWLNGNMNQNSVVLAHHAFLFWARLYLDQNHTIIYYAMNSTKAIEIAQQNGFKDIYLIWWNQNVGWYPDIKVPENFKLNHNNGRIGIYIFSQG